MESHSSGTYTSSRDSGAKVVIDRQKPLRGLRKWMKTRVPFKIVRDQINTLQFGPNAPKSDECLWVDPQSITEAYQENPADGCPRFRRPNSGEVRGGDWDLSRKDVEDNFKHKACLARFREGLSWEETGIYDEILRRIAQKGSFDGLRTLSDVRSRYAALDRLADGAQKIGRLLARSELSGAYYRGEHGGIPILIARDGTPLRGWGGLHRFGLAQALDLNVIPVQLVVIHQGALKTDVLSRLRQPPEDYPLIEKRHSP